MDTDADPDPAIFVSGLQDVNKIFFSKLFCLFLFEDTFTSFFKDKEVIKKSQNSRNQCFSYHFCLMIEGSGSGAGFVSLANRFGSRRPKNIFGIRIMIRISNTNESLCQNKKSQSQFVSELSLTLQRWQGQNTKNLGTSLFTSESDRFQVNKTGFARLKIRVRSPDP
jgi:hypothetical protein